MKDFEALSRKHFDRQAAEYDQRDTYYYPELLAGVSAGAPLPRSHKLVRRDRQTELLKWMNDHEA